MVNAAKHAGASAARSLSTPRSTDDAVEVFVRDRGPGFDLDEVPEDRLGVRQSIVGRMERNGGHAEVRSTAEGTEVRLTLPRRAGEEERMSDRPRVVLVDDHRMFRTGVQAELGDRRVEVVGEAEDVDSAVARDHWRPAPRSCSSTCTCRAAAAPTSSAPCAAELPETRFLALSVSDAAEDVIAVIRAGARGYVTKSITGSELVDGDPPGRRRRRRLLAPAGGLRAGRLRRLARRPVRSTRTSTG